MTNHLTHQQLCDLLIDSAPEAAASAHLAACPACHSEFAALQSSLVSFRVASIQLAQRTIDQRGPAHRPLLLPTRRTRRFLTVPAYVAAAAALAIAVLLPLHTTTPVAGPVVNTPVVNTAAAQPTESDEALFEQINQDVAASVPGPMEPLANPTGQGSTR